MTGTRRATFTDMPGKALDVMQDFDVSRLGYEETEYRVDGTALSYELKGERGDDGKWEVTEGQTAPFRTRIVVRRPADPDAFSGTVVVEWHNVSAGIDAAPDWGFVHRHLAARGHAFVGVSAQKAGIDGGGIVPGGPELHLKVLAPVRYADLAHPGDAWAFDMFTQVAELLRGNGTENPLGGLEPERLIAAGESQSAAALVTYINAVDPHTRVFDGYFVHGRPGAGLAIDGVFLPSAARVGVGRTESSDTAIEIASRGERLRDDVRVPVLVLQSETDVIVLGSGRAEQPDADHVRLWEIAGAAHADTYTVSGSRHDDGTVGGARLAELLRPTRSLLIGNTEKAVNSGPQQHYVAQAAMKHLVDWVAGGPPPPHAPRLARTGDETAPYELDENGNVLGGIRTPWVDVPTAALSGLGQAGESFAFLFGTTDPFDEATLARLYPGGHAEYLERFTAALGATIEAGFLLEEDRAEILEIAQHSFPLVVA